MSVSILYDPANTIQGDDANTSLIAHAPRFMSIEGINPGLTSITVQARIHPDSVWHDYININIAEPNALVEFATKIPEVRVVRVGAFDFVIYSDGMTIPLVTI